jgi:hypothetical protein
MTPLPTPLPKPEPELDYTILSDIADEIYSVFADYNLTIWDIVFHGVPDIPELFERINNKIITLAEKFKDEKIYYIAILRDTFSFKDCLKDWTRIRDDAIIFMNEAFGEAKAKRLMMGLL